MNLFYKSFANASPGLKIFFAMGMAFLFMMIFLFFSGFLSMTLLGVDAKEISVASTKPLEGNNLNILRILQIGQTIGMFLVPALLLAWIFGKNPWKYLKANGKVIGLSVILVFVLVFLVQPFVNLTAVANRLLILPDSLSDMQDWMMKSEQTAKINTEAFLEVSSLWILFFNVIMVGVLPAIAEEFFFRGLIQKLFVDWSKNIHIGILFTALLFSAFHMQFYTFLPRLIMGLYLGYLFVWSGNIWVPVIAHFINNSVGVVGIYLIHNNMITDEIEPTELTSELVIMGIISGLICTGILFAIRKLYLRANNQPKNLPQNS